MAWELLEAADSCAGRLGRDMAGPAVFGPSNVAIHKVAVAADLGDFRTALRWAERTVLDLPGGFEERHSRYWIDVARSHVAEKQDVEAVDALLRAETVAPEEVHRHPLSRVVLTDLIGRERKGAVPALRPLARRCRVLA